MSYVFSEVAQNLPKAGGVQEAQPSEDQRQNDLLSAIQDREASSYGTDMDPSSTERATAIKYYLGEPFGNEIEGRSQVVSRDVSDTIEWIKPSLMKIFAGGDQICRFDPTGPEDVSVAMQESDYVDFVIQKKNPWFMIAYEWFTDALMTRNAYAMAYWEDKEEMSLERYKGLTDDQLALIGMDRSVEIVAHQSYPAYGMPPSQMAVAVAQAMGTQPMAMLHDCEARRKKTYGCTKIVVLPPERCLVAYESRSVCVRDAAFFEYWEYKTLSDLRIEGFSIDDDIADTGGGTDTTLIDQSRDITAGTVILGEQTTRVDPAMRRVKVRTLWIRHDYDGDGISEHRYVVIVGSTFLVNQECHGIPVACIVPTPMPHRHIGLSLADAVMDLQLIKSAMQRQVVDNTYLANNGRYGVDKNKVNLDDMMISRPGGVVRTEGPPGEAIFPFTHPQTAVQGIAVLQYLDSIRQYRTGTQQPFVGPETISSNMLPGTVDQLTSAASQRVELIARVIAEGVKDLFQIVHEVTLTNATAEDKIQLRGKWVTVDPRQWRKRFDMTLAVGLGVSNQRAHIASLTALIAYAKQALPYGLTSLNKIYNMLAELTKAMGFAAADRFWTEPPENAQIQPPPDFHIEVAKINAQAQLLVQDMKNHAEASITQLREEAGAARTFFEAQVESQNQAQERFLRAISEATDRMHELRLEHVRSTAQPPAKAETPPAPAPNITVHPPSVTVHVDKSGKKTITTPKGSKYTVEEG